MAIQIIGRNGETLLEVEEISGGVKTLLVDREGKPVDGNKKTYSFSVTGLVPAASATDILAIIGAPAPLITKITKLKITAVRGTSANTDYLIVKRSTANTGGTSTSPVIVPHVSTSAAATFLVKAYTANPTLGTLIGALDSEKLYVYSSGASDKYFEQWGMRPAQAITLLDANEMIAINLNGVTITSGVINISGEITVE